MSELVPLGICSFVKFWLDENRFPRVTIFTKRDGRLIPCGETPIIYDIPVDWVYGERTDFYKFTVYFGEQDGLRLREGTLKGCEIEWGSASCAISTN